MNPLLEKKFNELENAHDYECWYLVKQPTEFCGLCYLVSILINYKNEHPGENLQTYVEEKIDQLQEANPDIPFTKNYRALRVAAFFGLITMTSTRYEEANISDTFTEITNRCDGHYENIDAYSDIIQRQIEKMFISSQIDEAYQTVRQNFRLYPVMLLYKVLLELGRATGEYRISMTEYRYFVATTKVFEDNLETLLFIKLLREEEDAQSVIEAFEQFREKFDNRLIQALKQLNTLIITNDSISLNPTEIEEVAKKIFIFEQNTSFFVTDDYMIFLGSSQSLFDLARQEIENDDVNETNEINEARRLSVGANFLLYGVPGSGKSWTIEHEYSHADSIVERIVFHPDYTNADFIGQILPVVDEEKQVTYEFVPGPFTTIIREAYSHPMQEYVLIIEEINRGNAPAIFGELFQLLDRILEPKEIDGTEYMAGTSEYGITHSYMAEIIYGDSNHKVRIPSNLILVATMNTSDQNVFTLDTAFQRRWEMRLIENNFDNVRTSLANAQILDTGVTWKTFCEKINDVIIGNRAMMASAEDKRLGVYFVHESYLTFDQGAVPSEGYTSIVDEYNELLRSEMTVDLSEEEKQRLSEIRRALKHNRIFPEKVIKFLWDDAFKFNPEMLFDTTNAKSLEQVIRTFVYSNGHERFRIFKQDIYAYFYPDTEN